MPRSSKVELCMICSEVPCTCFAKPPKAAKPRPAPVEKAVEEPTPKRTSAARASMKAAASAVKQDDFAMRYLTPPRPRNSHGATTSVDDILFADAIRSLSSILHPEERERYQMILSSAPSVDDRAAAWRARNGNV